MSGDPKDAASSVAGCVEEGQGAAAEDVWQMLEDKVLEEMRPSEVKAAAERAVPSDALDGDRVRAMAMWALKLDRKKGGRVESAKAILLYIKCEC